MVPRVPKVAVTKALRHLAEGVGNGDRALVDLVEVEVLVIGEPIADSADAKAVEVVIVPTHRDLQDPMECIERRFARNHQSPSDRRPDPLERHPDLECLRRVTHTARLRRRQLRFAVEPKLTSTLGPNPLDILNHRCHFLVEYIPGFWIVLSGNPKWQALPSEDGLSRSDSRI